MSDTSTLRWRPIAGTTSASPQWRLWRRVCAVALYLLAALGCCAWFAALVAWPISLPRPHFAFLAGDASENHTSQIGVPIQPYLANEVTAWTDLALAIRPHDDPQQFAKIHWNSRNDLRRFAEQLNRRAANPEDALIIGVSAHGFVDEGVAYLHWHFGTGNPKAERIRFQELLAQLADGYAGTKLLILDAGGWPTGIRDRLSFNDFPAVAARELAEIQDPDLWILLSHRDGEVSHISPTLKRSLFGNFVTAGLAGAADINQNGAISIPELSSYVQQRVSEAVRQMSDGTESQTPQLFSLAGTQHHSSSERLLLPVTNTNQPDLTARQPFDDSHSSSSGAGAQPGAQHSSTPSDSAVAGTATQPSTNPVTASSANPPKASPPATPSATSSSNNQDTPSGAQASTSPSPTDSTLSTTSGGSLANAGSPAASASSAAAQTKPAASGSPSATTTNATSTAPAQTTPAASSSSTANIINRVWTPDAAWTLRDSNVLDTSTPRILDLAPHFWREFEAELVEWEQSTDFRRDIQDPVWPSSLQDVTADLAAAIQALQSRTDPPPPRTSLGQRLAVWIEPYLPPDVPLVSLGLSRFAANELGTAAVTIPAEISQQFEQLVNAPTADGLLKWLNQSDASTLDCVEVHLARSLLTSSDIPWSIVQQALRTRIMAERAAIPRLGQLPWVRDRLQQADADRLAAERLLFDDVDPERFAGASAWLSAASAVYQQAQADCQLLSEVEILRNSLLYQSNDLFRWWFLSKVRRSSSAPDVETLLTTYSTLSEVSQLLESRDASKLPRLQKLGHQLRQLQRELDSAINQLPVASNEFGVEYAGGATAADVLMGTSLPRGPVRSALWPAARTLHTHEFDNIIWRPLSLTPQPGMGREHEDATEQLVRLQVALSELIALDAPQVDPTLKSLRDAQQRFLDELHQEGGSPARRSSQQRQSYREFHEALQRYVYTKTGRVASTIRSGQVPSARADLKQLVIAHRVLFVLDPSDLNQNVGPSLMAAIQAGYWHELFVWLRDRALVAQRDIPTVEAKSLVQVANALDAAAQQIPNQSAPPAHSAAPIAIQFADQVSLELSASASLDVQVSNQASQSQSIWLLVDYDPQILAIEPQPTMIWKSYPELRTQWMSTHGGSMATSTRTLLTNVDLISPEKMLWDAVSQTAPSLELAAGQSTTVRLPFHRLNPSSHSTRLIVKAVTSEHLVRGECEVTLPAPAPVNLVAGGRPNTWTITPTGVELHPFPNQSTEFQLSLMHRLAVSRKLEVGLVLPPGTERLSAVTGDAALPRSIVEDWFQREFGSPLVVQYPATVTLPANGNVPLQLTLPRNASNSPAGSGSPPAPASNSASASAPASTSDLAVSLDAGGWIWIRDVATDLVVLRTLKVTPQHPRRYVQPSVRYDADRGRVEITIQPDAIELLPASPVTAMVHFDQPLPADGERRLSGILTATSGPLTLFAELPRESSQIRLFLDVNDYPRAFAFDVSRDASRNAIPESTDLLAARITSPKPGTPFAGSVPALRIRCEWDVPLGSLDTEGTLLEIGIDLNRDRILTNGPSVRCTSDRMVNAQLTQTTTEGIWTIQTTVTDYEVDLPVAGVGSGRWDLLAQMSAGQRKAWSMVVPVVLDSEPPVIESVALTPPARVEATKPLVVTIEADDNRLSGVASVELFLDQKRMGTWDPQAQLIQAVRGAETTWTATLPTDKTPPGTYPIVVRATDMVGNVSPVQVTTVRILSAAEAQALLVPPTGQVAGTVFYGEQAQAGIKVTLTGDDPKQVFTHVTDSSGSFLFPKVPQGKYKLTAEGVVRNKRRKVEQDLELNSDSRNQVKTIALK